MPMHHLVSIWILYFRSWWWVGSGALARKETYPALFNMWRKQQLPRCMRIVAWARTEKSETEFRDMVRQGLPKDATQKETDAFTSICFYHTYKHMQADAGELHQKLLHLEDVGRARMPEALNAASSQDTSRTSAAPAIPCNRVFYLAIPPDNFVEAAKALRSGPGAMSERGWTRLLVEKPIGRDSASAAKANAEFAQLWKQDQIFRVDHFLGYAAVQQITTLRRDNRALSAVWNAEHVQSVEVILHEKFGVQGRGDYFDANGILRDVITNHLLEVSTQVGMEHPSTETSNADVLAWRDARLAWLRSVRPVLREELVVGQYGHGSAKQPAYVKEGSGIAEDSTTPTFALCVLRATTGPLKGVPFILRAGKGVHESKGEVRMQFKSTENPVFPLQDPTEVSLTFLQE